MVEEMPFWLHAVAELPQFLRDSEAAGLTEEERTVIVEAIAANPQQGDAIRGSGGLRKVRFAAWGKGQKRRISSHNCLLWARRPRVSRRSSHKTGSGQFQRGGNCRLSKTDKRNRTILATEKWMTKAAHRIMQGLREAAAHARGEKVPGLKLHIPRVVNVSAVRRRTGLSQTAFSRQIGVSPGTLRNWEQGRRAPEGPARVLLAMLSRNPRIVEETLGE